MRFSKLFGKAALCLAPFLAGGAERHRSPHNNRDLLPERISRMPASPLARAYAHNDYLHPAPLLDALEKGFGAVEADVHLYDGELRVAHVLLGVRRDRTLESLYLNPLRDIVRQHRGSVFPGSDESLVLMIDVKSGPHETYDALQKTLGRYEGLLTAYHNGEVRPGPVTVVVSDNREGRPLCRQGPELRYTACDGRIPDMWQDFTAAAMPVVSAKWSHYFSWRGEGEMPAPERHRLRLFVDTAHAQGRRIRFWGTPENPALWRELVRADVDYINTDKPSELRSWLVRNDIAPPGGKRRGLSL